MQYDDDPTRRTRDARTRRRIAVLDEHIGRILGALLAAATGSLVLFLDLGETWIVGALILAGALAYALRGLVGHARAYAMLLLTEAKEAATARDYKRAYALVARAERRSSSAGVRLSAATVRGCIALDRGWLEEAITELSDAIAIRPPRAQRLTHIEARSKRALALALAGGDGAARADVEHVRRALHADVPSLGARHRVLGGALARAALAEVVLAARAGSETVRAHGAVIRRFGSAEERALHRTLTARRTTARAWTPYRDAGSAEAPSHEPDARVAPRPAIAAPTRAPVRGAPPDPRVLIAIPLVTMIVGTTGLASFIDLVPPSTHVGRGLAGFAALAAAALVLRLRAAAAAHLELRTIHRLVARVVRGEVGALEALEAARPRSHGARVARAAVLASETYAEGRFGATLAHAEVGLAALRDTEAMDDYTLAELGDLRAAALAGLGVADEARGELAALPALYVGARAAETRVELLAALEAKQFEQATRIAETARDVELDAPCEAVVEVLLAARPGSRTDGSELVAEAAEVRGFLEAVAREPLEALTRG
ncbi:MAG: hypothetical protein U0414_05690 [Polyangiaceae bacterium]